MRILFLTSAHNSLSQRAQVELWERDHEVTVELALSDEVMLEAATSYEPDLIVAPMLKRAIPESVWRQWTCFIVHPGITGDRGPSSLDWAILEGEARWGVTVLQANEEMDAGDIWATCEFPMREASKSSLYKTEVVDAATKALLQAVERFQVGGYTPQPLDYGRADVRGRLRPTMRQPDRAIDWHAGTAEVARRIRSADGSPGVADELFGVACNLFGAHEEDLLRGEPGEVIAVRDGAICRATGDGAVWITHLRQKPDGIKLPAAQVLHGLLEGVPEVPAGEPVAGVRTLREIRYEEEGAVGHMHFDFYNGAMNTWQCRRLRQALAEALRRPTRVLVLWGSRDYFSNGIDLNAIEAADDPAQASWENINAINDVVHDLLRIDDRVVISALQGNAGAGGAILPLAADIVYARDGVVLNPHYKAMGGLYGSEYWTFLLPRRVGYPRAIELTENLLPVGTRAAERIGLIDRTLAGHPDDFVAEVRELAQAWATNPEIGSDIEARNARLLKVEARKPLADYRAEELVRMKLNFSGPDPSYHLARERFVRKVPALSTPLSIALHRRVTGTDPARRRRAALVPSC